MNIRRINIHVIRKLIVDHAVIALLMLDRQANVFIEREHRAAGKTDFAGFMAADKFLIGQQRSRSGCNSQDAAFIGVALENIRCLHSDIMR